MIDWQNIFDQKIRTSDDIRKVATGQGDDYRTGCLIDYNYFKNYYKMIAMDLSKQAFDGDPKAMLQINFYWKSRKSNSFKLFTRNCKSILILFLL